MKKLLPWLLFLLPGALAAREPTSYKAWVDGYSIASGAWNAETPTAQTIDLSKLRLGTGPHLLKIVAYCDDGTQSPPWTHRFMVEPGPQAEAVTYSIRDSAGNEVKTGPFSDDPQSGDTATLGTGLAPGPYRLVLTSHTLRTEGGFPHSRHVFIEPDSHRSFSPPIAESVAQLIDESGNVVKTVGLTYYDSFDDYQLFLSPLDMKELPTDSTLRLQVSLMQSNGQWFSSDLDTAPLLYRQEPFAYWIYDHGTGSRYDDPDGDGMSNLLEWYLKTDPARADHGVAPQLKATPDGLSVSWVGRGGLEENAAGLFSTADNEYVALQYIEHFGVSRHGWQTGLPQDDWLSDYPHTVTPLPGGMARHEVLIPYNSFTLEGTLLLRWAPASHFR